MTNNSGIIRLFSGTLLSSILFISCNGDSSSDSSPGKDSARSGIITPQIPAKTNPEISETDIKAFLYDKEGTYGWETKSDSISYDFFTDGRLHIQGPDGEATMWTGKWMLSGNQLTMESKDLKKKETLPVKIEGENLILGDKVYTRYAPK